MCSSADTSKIYAQIRRAVPSLRRYSRALTGTRDSGDRLAAAALELIMTEDVSALGSDGRIALFRAFHRIWVSAGQTIDDDFDTSGRSGRALQRLSTLTPNTREVLLLRTVEDMPEEDIALVVGLSVAEINRLLDIAFREMADRSTGSILIIEDEPFIAMDLQAIVANMGHVVSGVASTRAEALALAHRENFDLILSDIKLADNSRGSDAVADIFRMQREKPVVFITAYPEQLLTGEGWEPTFLITKPYDDRQVRTAVSEALFFAAAMSEAS